jgi:hypothetical protein
VFRPFLLLSLQFSIFKMAAILFFAIGAVLLYSPIALVNGQDTTTELPTTTAVAFNCENLDDGNYEHPQQPCSRFYFTCAGGVAIQEACPYNTVFEKTYNECQFKKYTPACGGELQTTTMTSEPRSTTQMDGVEPIPDIKFDCMEEIGNFPNPMTACSQVFFICAPGYQYGIPFHCAPTTFYDLTLNKCLYKSMVAACNGGQPIRPPQYGSDQFDCTDRQGNYAPENVNCPEYFYMCAAHRQSTTKVYCPTGLVYSVVNDTCLAPTEVPGCPQYVAPGGSSSKTSSFLQVDNETMVNETIEAVPVAVNETLNETMVATPSNETLVPSNETIVMANETIVMTNETVSNESTILVTADNSTLVNETVASNATAEAIPAGAADEPISTTLAPVAENSTDSVIIVNDTKMAEEVTTFLGPDTTTMAGGDSATTALPIEGSTPTDATTVPAGAGESSTAPIDSTTALRGDGSSTDAVSTTGGSVIGGGESTAEPSTVAPESTTVSAIDASNVTGNPALRFGACKDRINGFYPNPADCTTYFFCADTAEYQIQCQGNMVFNEKKNQCDQKANVFKPCGDKDLPPSFDCSGKAVGRHPDPVDCNVYYSCDVNGEMVQHRCEGGLSFNAAAMQCDLPQNIPGCAPRATKDLTQFCTAKEKDDIYALGNPNNYVLCVQKAAFVGVCPQDRPIFDVTVKSCVKV